MAEVRLLTNSCWLGFTATAMAVCGCAIPDYHLPHGFSSSYYRHLQAAAPVMTDQPVINTTPQPQNLSPPAVNRLPPAPPPMPATEAMPRAYTPPPPEPGL
ncbi:hypothetical protein GC163_03735 [bacterium]|nr:hypothetical protein [bacterium]